MNLPSIKTLSTIFGDRAKEARRILELGKWQGLSQLPANIDWVKARYHPPSIYELKMNALNHLGNFHGVEGIENDDGEWFTYLNAGDCYAGTLIYWRGRYIVSTIGDIVENKRNKFNR